MCCLIYDEFYRPMYLAYISVESYFHINAAFYFVNVSFLCFIPFQYQLFHYNSGSFSIYKFID